jgi:putative ABC transport system permease protein
METLLKDLRYAVRMFAKSPGFAAVAILALALGIGANTAIFSVVNAVLLRPLPYAEPDRVVAVWQDYRARGGPEREWASPTNFYDWRDQNQTFESMAALLGWNPTLTGIAEPEQITGAAISQDMFRVLGVEPALGRAFRPEEDQQGGERVVILGHGLWKRRFAADPGVLGQTLSLGGESFTVIGVMPAGFQLPFITNSELFRPMRQVLSPRCGRGCVVLRAVARMKPGITFDGARADMSTIAARLSEQYPEANAGIGATLVPLHEQTVGNVRLALMILLAAVAFVLLIACANVANLLLARATARGREIAIRTALGAGRGRLIRQLLTESVLLALLGGALGLLLAFWLVELLVTFSPDGTPRAREIAVDGPMLVFTLGVALVTGVIFGLVPALQASRPDLNQSLKENKGANASGGGHRIRNVLVVAEIALALVLLVGAGLLMKSFVNLLKVDPGFNAENVLTLRVGLPRTRYPEPHQINGFYSQLIERVKGLPGVGSAGATSTLPLGGSNSDTSFIIEGRPVSAGADGPVAWYSSVTTDYFSALGMRLTRGRLFDERDQEKTTRVVVISQEMARRYWPDEDPIGKRIGNEGDEPDWTEIVGIVADVKQFGLTIEDRPTMYFPQSQQPSRVMFVAVRGQSDPTALAGAVRGQVSELDKDLAVSQVLSMKEVVSRSVAEPRFTLLLLTVFAGLALVLAAVGIYGVMSYSVTQRRHEIGIRMALGASSGEVLRLVVGHGLVLTAAGVGIGLGAAVALTRVMESLLYGVSATDPLTFAAIALLLTAVAVAASFIPARRATRVDPMIALRYE